MSKVIVRHATIEDEDALFDLYVAEHREVMGRRGPPYDYRKMMAGIQRATRKRGGICGVIDEPNRAGRLAAMVFLYIDQFWWSECSYLMMRECFVRREYRKGTGYYIALRQFAEDIRLFFNEARPSGHPPIILEAQFITDDPRKERLMDRLWARWGKRVGGIYLSGIPEA